MPPCDIWNQIRVGERVVHMRYGNGTIVGLDDRYIDIKFATHHAKFYFPEAFERGFLRIDKDQVISSQESQVSTLSEAPSTALNKEEFIEEESSEFLQIAQNLFALYPTMAEFRKHSAEYFQEYGPDAYNRIYRILQKLRREAIQNEEQFDPSNCYSDSELQEFRMVSYLLAKASDAQVRNRFNELKSRYRSLPGIIASCYPHQMEDGRPAKKHKNPISGENEWHAYKRISFDSIKNMYIDCLDNYLTRTETDPIIEVHNEGDPIISKKDSFAGSDYASSLNSCLGQIQDVYDSLENVLDEEQEAYDNLPEGIQCSDRGDLMQEGIDSLEEAISYIEEAISNLGEVSSKYVDQTTEKALYPDYKPGTSVSHKSFGKGIILSAEEGSIIISFKHRKARFRIPGVFESGFLTICE